MNSLRVGMSADRGRWGGERRRKNAWCAQLDICVGVVIRLHGGGSRETMTVRKVSFGVGVERILPIHSPRLEKIEVVRRAKVRQAKLYFLRDLRGKAARLKELKPKLDPNKKKKIKKAAKKKDA